MLKNIYFKIKNDEKYQIEGVKSNIINSQAPSTVDTLIVTDQQELLRSYKAEGYAVLFLYDGDRFIEGADYITDSLEDCDEDYYEMIFCRQKGLPMTILQTERTVIREATVEDLPELYKLYDDDAIRLFLEPLYDYDKEKAFIKDYIKNMYGFRGFGMWLVFAKSDGRLIGRAGIDLRNIDGVECPEIGYIIHKNYRRCGYATEVCNAITEYAFSKLDMDRLNLLTTKDNIASINTAKKIGFRESTVSLSDERYVMYEKTHN